MKLVLIFICVCLLSNSIAYAQDSITVKSKPDLHEYHYQEGDPYRPGVMGFASFVLPGLGQLLEGEAGRAFLFFGGGIGLNLIRLSYLMRPESGSLHNEKARRNIRYMLLGLHVWALFDAVHMAKVNNVKFRNQNPGSVSLNLAPYFGSDDYNKYINNTPVGLTLLVNF
jgi:hypothetical protein